MREFVARAIHGGPFRDLNQRGADRSLKNQATTDSFQSSRLVLVMIAQQLSVRHGMATSICGNRASGLHCRTAGARCLPAGNRLGRQSSLIVKAIAQDVQQVLLEQFRGPSGTNSAEVAYRSQQVAGCRRLSIILISIMFFNKSWMRGMSYAGCGYPGLEAYGVRQSRGSVGVAALPAGLPRKDHSREIWRGCYEGPLPHGTRFSQHATPSQTS